MLNVRSWNLEVERSTSNAQLSTFNLCRRTSRFQDTQAVSLSALRGGERAGVRWATAIPFVAFGLPLQGTGKYRTRSEGGVGLALGYYGAALQAAPGYQLSPLTYQLSPISYHLSAFPAEAVWRRGSVAWIITLTDF